MQTNINSVTVPFWTCAVCTVHSIQCTMNFIPSDQYFFCASITKEIRMLDVNGPVYDLHIWFEYTLHIFVYRYIDIIGSKCNSWSMKFVFHLWKHVHSNTYANNFVWSACAQCKHVKWFNSWMDNFTCGSCLNDYRINHFIIEFVCWALYLLFSLLHHPHWTNNRPGFSWCIN